MTKLMDASVISESQGVVVVVFTALWDSSFVPIKTFLATKPDLKVFTVDFDEDRDLVHKFSVLQIPHILVFKDGGLVSVCNNLDELVKSVCQNF